MSGRKSAHTLLLLALGPALGLGGCIHTGGPEWKWQRCYSGPSRAGDAVSTLLVGGGPIPLRIDSIDGRRVREATEYQLLPGAHVVVSRPDLPRRFLIEYRDDARALTSAPSGACTAGVASLELELEPGEVYRLTAELDWQKDDTRVYWQGRGGKWRPRVELLGSFETLKNDLARQQDPLRADRRENRAPSDLRDVPWPMLALQTLAKPPKHWRTEGNGR